MRCIYVVLLCLLSVTSYAQNTFQIELVDANVGTSLSEPPYMVSNLSNDAGLNDIFTNHNVFYYTMVYGYGVESMMGKNGFISCDCNPQELIQDVLAYDTVVEFVAEIDSETGNNGNFYNGLQINLLNAANGSFQALQNGIVVTNNSQLNQIFTDFNVRVYETVYASNIAYQLVCDCEASLLKQELDNLSSVIDSTEFINYFELLSIEESQLEKTEIYPNPFKNKITLATSGELKAIELYDVLGKRVINTQSISNFESSAVRLKDGIYILKLTDTSGKTETKKLVKQ